MAAFFYPSMTMPTEKKIILFDGYCNLCNGAVDFILRHDHRDEFRFGSLQGVAGQALLNSHHMAADTFNTFILLEDGKIFTRSTAALRVLKHLGKGWQAAYIFIIVPAFIRDGVYAWISRNRYRWFGKSQTCRMATEREKQHFLD